MEKKIKASRYVGVTPITNIGDFVNYGTGKLQVPMIRWTGLFFLDRPTSVKSYKLLSKLPLSVILKKIEAGHVWIAERNLTD